MPKVKTNEPPQLGPLPLLKWKIVVRSKFTKLTCPKCRESFYVQSTRWASRRRAGWTQTAPCPFCFRASSDPQPITELWAIPQQEVARKSQRR